MAGRPRTRERNAEKRRANGLPYRRDLVNISDPLQLAAVLEETLSTALEIQRDARRQYRQLQGKWRFTDDHGGEQLRSEVGVLERATERTTRALLDVGKLSIDRQRIALEKRHAELIANVILTVIEDPDLALSPAQKRLARTRTAGQLLTAADDADSAGNTDAGDSESASKSTSEERS